MTRIPTLPHHFPLNVASLRGSAAPQSAADTDAHARTHTTMRPDARTHTHSRRRPRSCWSSLVRSRSRGRLNNGREGKESAVGRSVCRSGVTSLSLSSTFSSSILIGVRRRRTPMEGRREGRREPPTPERTSEEGRKRPKEAERKKK